ncbi:MAG: CCA tRNA nucleotidyltransferase [Treponema sp.]|jgi:putative nucleotidyltransferase with HDIG domain|nr:CCA tRNA nucleotidyltransferase [Treponema sp.]
MNIHPLLKEIALFFAREGKLLYLVGGAVRDQFRGKKSQDWDLATDARPEEVIALFRKPLGEADGSGGRGLPSGKPPAGKARGFVVPTGIKHGTVTVHYKNREFEVTTFRTESDYLDGRHPERLAFAGTIEEDLSRRDFTMNAIALKLPEGKIVDPFDGRGDIREKIIRCVGDPLERFGEDGLRPLRALRFAAQLGFALDGPTREAIPKTLDVAAKVSPERVRGELDKIIASPFPSPAFRLMEETGLMELFLPELAACRGVEQKGYHRFDVLDHSLLACDYAARHSYPEDVRLAALFHDIGKPQTRKAGEQGVWTFHRHEQVSAEMSGRIMGRFRYPKARIDAVRHLVAEHMFHYQEAWSDGAVRRFVIRAGEENLDNLYRLRRSDAYGMTGTEPAPDGLAALISRVDAVLAQGKALSLKDLAVSGNDLIEMGIQPGKHMGIILGELLEAVVDDPELNSREKLLEIAGRIKRRYACG